MYHSWRRKTFNTIIDLYSFYTFPLTMKESFYILESSQYKVGAYIACASLIGLTNENLITKFFQENSEAKLKSRHK